MGQHLPPAQTSSSDLSHQLTPGAAGEGARKQRKPNTSTPTSTPTPGNSLRPPGLTRAGLWGEQCVSTPSQDPVGCGGPSRKATSHFLGRNFKFYIDSVWLVHLGIKEQANWHHLASRFLACRPGGACCLWELPFLHLPNVDAAAKARFSNMKFLSLSFFLFLPFFLLLKAYLKVKLELFHFNNFTG